MNQEEFHEISENKRQLIIGLILAVLFPVISFIVNSILQHTNIQITVIYQPIQYGKSVYPAQIMDVLIMFLILILNKRIISLREETEHISYKLYNLRRRRR